MRDERLEYEFVSGRNDGTKLLKLDGPLTLINMFDLQDELRETQPETLILDLSGVPYMDSAGLGLIMNYYVSSEHHGRKFLLAGVNERVRALIEMTKVDSVLKLFATVEAAEESL